MLLYEGRSQGVRQLPMLRRLCSWMWLCKHSDRPDSLQGEQRCSVETTQEHQLVSYFSSTSAGLEDAGGARETPGFLAFGVLGVVWLLLLGLCT